MANSSSVPATLRPWLEIGMLLAETAGSAAVKALADVRPRRRGSFRARQPGADTPAWNACVAMLREELRAPGAKARLARYLGIPRQRLTDYLKNSSRLPDAELTLQMIHWLARKRAGEDLSL